MFPIVEWSADAHDPSLLLIAVAVCCLASLVTFDFFSRTLQQQNKPNLGIWLALTTVAASSGIWATHFIAMAAFTPPVALGFAMNETALSFLVACVFTGSAVLFATSYSGRVARLGAGALIGVGASLMHYVGTKGLQVAGHVSWNGWDVAASIAAAVSFSMAAFVLIGLGDTVGKRALGASLFAVAIISLHFLGMAAITIKPDPLIRLAPNLLSGTALGYGVTGVTCMVLICAFTVWLVDHRARRDSEVRMSFLARHDLLTGLPNRLLFSELVGRDLVKLSGSGRSAAVMCLDLDGFKEINDIFGHAAGDALLNEVARRLQALLQDGSLCARLGGDEFAVFTHTPDGAETAARVAGSILDSLAKPYTIDGNRVDVGCSLGVALTPDDGVEYQALLIKSDVALSKAKTDGRGIVRFFEPEMDERMRERRRLAQDLRTALDTGQLRLVYQPQLDLNKDRVSGFEVLTRWDHPTDGPIPPTVFIPLAEETGLILRIGEWALREACTEAATWAGDLTVAVNVSVAQFRQANLDQLVDSILRETGLAPHRLEIEVTESLFFENVSRTIAMLTNIKMLGVRVSMDDFGTGYSSLSTLQSFPFDKIKIDRSFTAQIGEADKGAAIVKAIVGLGSSLAMRVVAEGVETGEQLAFLREQQCSAMQGFMYGKPKPIEEYRDLLAVAQADAPGVNVVRLRPADLERRPPARLRGSQDAAGMA